MTSIYHALITDVGLAKLAAASASAGDNPLVLSTIAFGDGAGGTVTPMRTAAALVRERYRSPISDRRVHETDPRVMYVDGAIPAGVGGWTLREAGIFDDDGDLIVIACTPEVDVAVVSSGASVEGLVRLPLVFDGSGDVTLMIDPTIVLATQAWVLSRLLGRPFVTVNSISRYSPPAIPSARDSYVIPADATGAWQGHGHQIAQWTGTAWVYADALPGHIICASDTGGYWRRSDSGWDRWHASTETYGITRIATADEMDEGLRDDIASPPSAVRRAIRQIPILFYGAL